MARARRLRGPLERLAAIAQQGRRPPDLEQRKQRNEAQDRAGDVGKVWAEIDGDRILAEDVAERRDDRERPAVLEPLLAGDEVDEDEGRQQRQHRDDRAD